MTSPDDPEARIRDLERPSPPPPYGGPVSYGMQFPPPMPPGRPPSTNWLLYAVVAGVVAIIVGAVAFFSSLFSGVGAFTDAFRSSSTVTVPTPVGGGGSFATPPSGPPVPVEAPTVSPAAPGAVVDVAGVGEHKTIECRDNAVNVSGVSNIVVITGQCASVSVSGVENTITVASSAFISVSGLDNRVTYTSGSPEIDSSGTSNVVEHG